MDVDDLAVIGWVLPLVVAALLKAIGAYDLEKTSHPLGFADRWFGGPDVPLDAAPPPSPPSTTKGTAPRTRPLSPNARERSLG